MKFISTLFIALGLITSTSLHANDSIVSVTVNKQTYQFDRPIRLSSVLSIVADSGDWYWPSASAFDLTNPTAEREKEIALSQIRELLVSFDKNSDTHKALQNLLDQVASWTVSTRIDMPISYNRARLFFEDNPMFQPGKYLTVTRGSGAAQVFTSNTRTTSIIISLLSEKLVSQR